MNYSQFIAAVKATSLANIWVKEFHAGDIYDYLNSGEHKYGNVVLTVDNITMEGDMCSVSCSLFYSDRLCSDSSNETAVQTQAMNVLRAIAGVIQNNFQITVSNQVFNPYTESFADLCAGAYMACSMSFPAGSECNPDEFEEIVLSITENGLYSTLGYTRALVSVSVAGFLSLWNSSTGLPTVPPSTGYAYKAGDYYIVDSVATGSCTHQITLIGQSTEGLYEGTVNYNVSFSITNATQTAYTTIAQIAAAIEALGTEVRVPATGKVTLEDSTEVAIVSVIAWESGSIGLVQTDGQKACLASGTPTTLTDTVSGSAVNYKPSGSTYTGASSVVESSTVKKGDAYYYDGSAWNMQINTARSELIEEAIDDILPLIYAGL